MGKSAKIILILVLAVGLRLINLNQSFWLDEASQAQMSSLSVQQIWFERVADFHPPFFYLLAHFWLHLGHSEMWLRLLPVLFGVLTVWVMYVFFKDKTATIAALLLAVNPFHIYYSQEFRAYSLLALLGTLSMYFLFKKKYVWVAIINALLLYTHYSSVLLILTQFFLAPVMLYYSLLTFILYLPWLPQFIRQLHSGVNIDQYLPGWRQILTISPWKALPLILFKFSAGRINLTNKIMYLVYILFVLGTTTAAVLVANLHRKFLYSWFILPIILSLLISFVIPQTQPFRLIFVLPALIFLLAQTCVKFPKIFITIFIYIAVFGNVLYFTRPRLQREEWRQAISYINMHPDPAIIAFSGKFAPMQWYPTNFPVIAAVPTFPARPEDVTQRLVLLPSKVYYFEYLSDLTDPNRQVKITLENLGYKLVATHDFDGVGFVFEYVKP